MHSPRDEADASTLVRAPVATAPEGAGYALTVIEGPDTGKVFRVDGGSPTRALIGQSHVCEVRLTDRQVSRRHAAVQLSGAELRITDMDSTNGTTVNGLRVLDALLTGGEVIRLGETALRVDAAPSARQPVSSADRFGSVVGSSVEMRRLHPLFERLSQSDVAVVIEGETGTGKEVLAEALHESSARKAGPFVVFDCTAVPPHLVESELFGHERGAFTGAVAAHKGVFEQAHGGTLLLDEIGDLETSLQPKLLRVIERSDVRRVGSERVTKVDVRVMAATRRDLDREVQDGRFRDDLYFRLAVARVELPPLRERRGDIGVLAAHFWRTLGGREGPLPYELLSRFERYSWPGNVRELANAVARHLAIGDLDLVATRTAAAADPFEAILLMDQPFSTARQQAIAEFERRYLARVLARHAGNVTKAAQASGIARRYFSLIMARHTKA
jgi:transcriptional regulator with GAF, ATPase, and Fis domain